jgi:hypothetical protein
VEVLLAQPVVSKIALAARLAVAKQEHLELLKEQIVKYSQTHQHFNLPGAAGLALLVLGCAAPARSRCCPWRFLGLAGALAVSKVGRGNVYEKISKKN